MKKKIGKIVFAIVILAFLLIQVYPIIWLFMASVKPTIELSTTPFALPKVVTFENFIKVFSDGKIGICITKISTFLILCDLAVCLATLYVSFSLVFALMRYLQGKVFLIRFYSPTTLSSSRAEFRLPSRLACA